MSTIDIGGQPHRWDGTDWVPVKKRRVFLWVFLAVQAVFLLWIIGGLGSVDTGDCTYLNDQECADAATLGATLGVFFVVAFWGFVDIILGVGYGIYRLTVKR